MRPVKVVTRCYARSFMRGVVAAGMTVGALGACASFGASTSPEPAPAASSDAGPTATSDAPVTTDAPAPPSDAATDAGPGPKPAGTFLQQASVTHATADTGQAPSLNDDITLTWPTTAGNLIVVVASSPGNALAAITTDGATVFGTEALHSSQHVNLGIWTTFALDSVTRFRVVWSEKRAGESVVVVSEWAPPGQVFHNSNVKHDPEGPIATNNLDVTSASALLIAIAASQLPGHDPTNGFTATAGDHAASTFLDIAWRSVSAGDNYSTSWTQDENGGQFGWDTYLLSFGK